MIGLPDAFILFLRNEGAGDGTGKFPHNAQRLQEEIEGLALSAIAAFIAGAPPGKFVCLSSLSAQTSVRVSIHGEDEGEGGRSSMLLCRMLRIGLQDNVTLPNRLLALRLLEALARKFLHGGATLRNIIHNDITVSLRNDLKSNSLSSVDSLPRDVFSVLMDSLASVLLLPTDNNSRTENCGQLTTQYQTSALPFTSAVTSILELVVWTYNRYSDCSTIVLSLTRFIGRLSCENSFLSNHRWIVTCRKTFAIVLSEEILDTIAASCMSRHCTEVRILAMASLWFILHRSERARSFFKAKGHKIVCSLLQNNKTNPPFQTDVLDVAGKMVGSILFAQNTHK